MENPEKNNQHLDNQITHNQPILSLLIHFPNCIQKHLFCSL